MWKSGVNMKYGLIDPNDPSRQRTISERTTVARGLGFMVANRKNLDETLHQLVQKGQIKSRSHMTELLEKNGYQITRKNAESLSVKHIDIGKKALRLKGGIYSETFTSIGGIESLSEERERRIATYNNRATQEETRTNRSTYKRYLQTRIDRHKKRYPGVRQIDSKKSWNTQKRDADDMVNKDDYENKRRVENDRIRESINTNRRKREESLTRAREREAELFKTIKEFNLRVQKQFRAAEQELYSNLTESRENMEADIANSTRRIDAKIIHADTKNRSFTERIRELFEGINERIKNIAKSIKGVINEIKKIKLFKESKKEMVFQKKQNINLSRRR